MTIWNTYDYPCRQKQPRSPFFFFPPHTKSQNYPLHTHTQMLCGSSASQRGAHTTSSSHELTPHMGNHGNKPPITWHYKRTHYLLMSTYESGTVLQTARCWNASCCFNPHAFIQSLVTSGQTWELSRLVHEPEDIIVFKWRSQKLDTK